MRPRAPSVSGVLLPAVSEPDSLRSKTGRSFVSFSRLESGRTLLSWASPLYSTIRSSKKPSAWARAAFRWLAWVRVSCSSRVIFHSLAVSSMLSPMERLVRGSFTSTSRGLKCLGRSASHGFSFSPAVRPRALSSRIRR